MFRSYAIASSHRREERNAEYFGLCGGSERAVLSINITCLRHALTWGQPISRPEKAVRFPGLPFDNDHECNQRGK